MTKLTWEEIEDAASDIVDVWAHGRDVDWLKETWEILEKQNLTFYSNEIDKIHVYAKLILLGVLYQEFNALAHGESREYSLESRIDSLEINRFRVAQAVDSDFYPDEDLDEDELTAYALQDLVESKRSIVFKALLKHLKNEIGILDHFLKFTESNDYDSEKDETDDFDDFGYDYDEAGIFTAEEWISDGFSSIIEYE